MSETNATPQLREYLYVFPERVIDDLTLDINDLRVYGIISSMFAVKVPEEELALCASARLNTPLDIVKTSISKLIDKGYIVR